MAWQPERCDAVLDQEGYGITLRRCDLKCGHDGPHFAEDNDGTRVTWDGRSTYVYNHPNKPE